MKPLHFVAALPLAALAACGFVSRDYWGPEPLLDMEGHAPSGGGPRAPDLDADGFADLLVMAREDPRDPRLLARVHSSVSGEPLRSFYAPSDVAGSHCAAWLPDVDGDGVEDLALGSGWGGSHVVLLYSGASTALLRTWGEGERKGFGVSLASAGDLDGDGAPELLVGATGTPYGEVVVLPARGGAPLARWKDETDPRFGTSLALLDDLDGDGVGDVAVGSSDYDGGRGDCATIVSARTGVSLRVLPQGGDVATTLDLDGDGSRDLLLTWRGGTAVWSPARGERLRSWEVEHGWVGALLDDLDGDGEPERVIERAVTRSKPFDQQVHRVFELEGSTGKRLLEVEVAVPFSCVWPLSDVTGDGVGDLAIEAPPRLLVYSLGDLRD